MMGSTYAHPTKSSPQKTHAMTWVFCGNKERIAHDYLIAVFLDNHQHGLAEQSYEQVLMTTLLIAGNLVD